MSTPVINQALIRPVNTKPAIASQNNLNNNNVSFESYLRDSMASKEVKFSKHAESRLQSRNINFSKEQKSKLDAAVSKADQKGIRDSLIMMDNVALVVNVKSRTVVTAMSNSEAKENIFTNIDGAIFA
jgi:flagellar operon protein